MGWLNRGFPGIGANGIRRGRQAGLIAARARLPFAVSQFAGVITGSCRGDTAGFRGGSAEDGAAPPPTAGAALVALPTPGAE
ncbi:hypothetical protein, partial [Dickeya dadantii]|uniref:hypothetical protein n=1 Tax=Dickeya dadantii TaxID=204038 RepID=UPI001373138B